MGAFTLRLLLLLLTLVGYLLLWPSPVFAAWTESSRGQTTVTVGQNAITVDNDVKYGAYGAGEGIMVALEYSATCSIVFTGLTPFKPIPFAPPRIVTGEIANVRGTPARGHAANTGSVTFDIRFNALMIAGDVDTGKAVLRD